MAVKKMFALYALTAFTSVAGASKWLEIEWQDTPVGPDGPWNALFVGVDGPAQNMTMFPTLTRNSLLINESACTNGTAPACPTPTQTLWNSAGHTGFAWMNSADWDVQDTFTGNAAEPLALEGTGQFIHQTWRVYSNDQGATASIMDQGVALSNDVVVKYPGGATYTLDTGFFSLYGASTNQSWQATNQTVSFYLALAGIVHQDITASSSFGLHMGSANYGVNGSLMIGAYDKSRCLTDPITSSNTQTFELDDIGLELLGGGSTDFIGLANGNTSGLLKTGTSNDSLVVLPNPGVPYLNLPQATCDAIASHLPVTYNSSFGLYFWDTTDAVTEQITSKPHVLNFVFKSGSSTSTISVPFALLNLTLENPLISPSVQYFPCSPYTPTDGSTYHLGRAFLQAAFLAHNWDSNTTWLAQAPGPDLPDPYHVAIGASDTSIGALTGTSFYDTWKSTWNTSEAATSTTHTFSSSSLSGGAIAGIVIGALAAIAILLVAAWLYMRRRKRTIHHEQVPQDSKEYPLVDQHASTPSRQHYSNAPVYSHEAPASEIHEMADHKRASNAPLELPNQKKPLELSSRQPVSELPGSEMDNVGGRHD